MMNKTVDEIRSERLKLREQMVDFSYPDSIMSLYDKHTDSIITCFNYAKMFYDTYKTKMDSDNNKENIDGNIFVWNNKNLKFNKDFLLFLATMCNTLEVFFNFDNKLFKKNKKKMFDSMMSSWPDYYRASYDIKITSN
jgi:hypothetical protein